VYNPKCAGGMGIKGKCCPLRVRTMTTLLRVRRKVTLAGIAITLCSLFSCDSGPAPHQPPPQSARPDLMFTGRCDFQLERTLPPQGNDLYTIVVEVRNKGTGSVPRVQVAAHSRGPGIQGDRPPLDNGGYYAVGPGQTIKARFQFIYERRFSGEYEFTFIVDPSNAVAEEDESNNRFVFKRKF
jgi:hypothetical protein